MRDSIKREYWWVSAGEVENESESPFIAMKYNSTFRDYSKLRKQVWNWYRARAGRTDLSPVSKLLLWSV